MSSSPITATKGDHSPFAGEKTISVETYRKTGVAVRTPVWFVEEDGELFVRTDARTGKAKRIRNNPKVRVAPCKFRGTPTGPWVDGAARILEKGQAERMFSLLKKKYGLSWKSTRFLQKIISAITRRKARPVCLGIRTVT